MLGGSASLSLKQVDPYAFIMQEEGKRLTAYQDGENYAICFGNHFYPNGVRVRKGDVASDVLCSKMIKHHVKKRTSRIFNQIEVHLFPSQKVAVLSYAYRNGVGGSKALAKCINSRHNKCIKTLIRDQVGVENRAKREWELWSDPIQK